jgi:hypothetical protein
MQKDILISIVFECVFGFSIIEFFKNISEYIKSFRNFHKPQLNK